MIGRVVRAEAPDTRGMMVVAGAVLAAVATGLLAAYNLMLGAAAVLALVVLAAAIFRPVLIVLLLFVSVYPSTFAVGGITIQRLGGPLAAITVAAQFLRGGVHIRAHKLTLWLVFGYVAVAAASLAWSLSPGATIDALAALAISVAYMAAVATVVRDAGELRAVLWVMTAWSAVLGAWWILSYLQGQSREFNVLGDPNFFSGLQVIVVPLAVALISHTSRRLLRLLLYAALAIIASSIVASLSRGGMVALLVVAVVMLIIPSGYVFRSGAHKLRFLGAAIAASMLVLALAGATLVQRFDQTLNDPTVGAGRGDLSLAALHGFHDHPVLGMGFGAFTSNSFQLLRTTPGVYLDLHLTCLDTGAGTHFRATGSFCVGQPVHNTYLESLVELGIPGLLLFVGILAAATRSLVRSARLAKISNDRFSASAGAALAVGLLGFAVLAATLSAETNRSPWMIVGLSLALPAMVGPARLWGSSEVRP